MMRRILMIEDDSSIVYALSELLREEGFETAEASSRKEALAAELSGICLILLDLGLPDGDGWIFLERLFAEGNMGADDYVTKPFKAGVLLSRIRAVLRRRQQPQEPGEVLRCGDILLDRQKTAVTVGGKEVALTAGEFRLLAYLMVNKNRTVTRGSLLAHFWDCEGDFVNDNTLTVTVKRLREKLGENSRRMLKTVRGIGYQMEDFND